MKLKAVGHRIIVRPKKIDKEIKTETGVTLYMPDQTRDMEQAGVYEGVVVAIGPDAYYDRPSKWVKEGDRITFPRYCGRHWPNDKDPEYYIMNDEDVLAVLKDEEETEDV